MSSNYYLVVLAAKNTNSESLPENIADEDHSAVGWGIDWWVWQTLGPESG